MFYKCSNCGKFVSKGIELCEDCFENGYEDSTNSQIKLEENGENATGTIITKNRPTTLDEMISLFDIDLNIWYAERIVINSWDVTTKEGNTYTNYQVKVFFKRNNIAWSYDKIKTDFIDAVKNHVIKYPNQKYHFGGQHENNLLEINIADLHIGKLSWGKETNENYDTKIACERFLNTLSKTIERAKSFDFDRILFPIGNDFFNVDNKFNTTSNGTPQDADIRWQKSYKIGRELLIQGIDYLSNFAPVDVVIVQGNHDFERMYYVGDTLELWYSNNENVTVNNNPTARKYYKYGNVLLGFTHGSNEKISDLPLIMAQESEDWSNTKFREIHVGHLHHRREIKYLSTQEIKGVVVRYLRSLSGTDQWHYSRGFVGNIKGSEAFLWNDRNGLICMFENNLVI